MNKDMKKKAIINNNEILSRIGMVVIIIIAFFSIAFYWYYSQVEKIDYSIKLFPSYFSKPNSTDGEYVIGGELFNLTNGQFEKKDNNGVSVSIIGKKLEADIDRDSISDVAFLVAYSNGNSISYYIVATIRKSNHYIPTNSVFIGEDIVQVELSSNASTIIERFYENRSDFENKDNEKIVYLEYGNEGLKQIIK